MDVHDFFVGVDAFRRGETRPLPMPESVSAELTINALSEDRRREWEAANGPIVGYQFPWGQIHEDPARDAGPDEIAMEWHFVLSDLHTEFLRAGGCLGEGNQPRITPGKLLADPLPRRSAASSMTS